MICLGFYEENGVKVYIIYNRVYNTINKLAEIDMIKHLLDNPNTICNLDLKENNIVGKGMSIDKLKVNNNIHDLSNHYFVLAKIMENNKVVGYELINLVGIKLEMSKDLVTLRAKQGVVLNMNFVKVPDKKGKKFEHGGVAKLCDLSYIKSRQYIY